MAPLTLFCAVYGAGAIFPIEIEREATVSSLQKAIVEAKLEVTPAEMTLFLARVKETGEWLEDDDWLDEFLQGEVSARYEKMCPTEPIGHALRLSTSEVPPSRGVVHVLIQLPVEPAWNHLRSSATKVWAVSGSIPKAPGIEVFHRRLYIFARKFVGFYDPKLATNHAGTAFWYDDTTLHFRVLFPTDHLSIYFHDAIEDETEKLRVPPTVKREAFGINRLAPVVSVNQLQLIRSAHFVQNDAALWLGAPNVWEVEPSTDAFRHLRIEREEHFVPHGRALGVRLMPPTECHRRRVAIDDDANNQLALSRDMHGWFDGIACDIPIVNIRPGAVEATPSVDGRYKVELSVTVLDAGCAFRVFSRLHSTAVKTEDPLTMKAHVFVADPATFVRCLSFKHEQIAARWSDFLCAA